MVSVMLHVSAKANYALRALVVLSTHPSGQPIKTAEIAACEGMPLKFLENILVDLRRKGLVTSARGPTGGFRLSRAADLITVADVLQAVDGPLSDAHDALDGDSRSRLQRVWVAAESSLRSVLEIVTLADLVCDVLPDHVDELLGGETLADLFT